MDERILQRSMPSCSRAPCPTRELGKYLDNHESVYQMPDCVENDVRQQGCNNTLMVVDTFANEQLRHQVASTFGYELPNNSRDPIELICYMKPVAEFGFNHIIFIGEIHYGMIFMDCFGRLFQWEDMLQMLWPLGDYSSSEANVNNKFAWFVVNDGVVYETI